MRSIILGTIKADSKIAARVMSVDGSLDVPIIVYGGYKEERVDESFLRRYIMLLLSYLHPSFFLSFIYSSSILFTDLIIPYSILYIIYSI